MNEKQLLRVLQNPYTPLDITKRLLSLLYAEHVATGRVRATAIVDDDFPRLLHQADAAWFEADEFINGELSERCSDGH